MSDKGRGGVWAHVGVCPATREEGCGGREGIGWGGGSASDRGGNRYRRKESQRLSVDSEVRLKCGKALVRLVRRKGAAHSYFGSTKTLDPPQKISGQVTRCVLALADLANDNFCTFC